MVCQNQSIDDSAAPLAHDLRLLVRERLEKGDSDQQVLDFLVARYGEFVLLKPRFELHTCAAVGAAAGGAAGRHDRAVDDGAPPPAAPICRRLALSAAEQERDCDFGRAQRRLSLVQSIDFQPKFFSPPYKSLIPPTGRCKAHPPSFGSKRRAHRATRIQMEIF